MAAAAVALVLLGWLGWAAWVQSNPDVSGGLRAYDVVSAHEVHVVVDLTRRTGDAVVCDVLAQADDHSTVGQAQVRAAAGQPGPLRLEATIRTEREATSASVSNCRTAP
jgi:hypothetical protein